MMKNIGIIIFTIAAILISVSHSPCEFILSTERIGYIDMEKVFNEYEGTKRAKSELSEEIREIREEIMRIEKEIQILEKKVESNLSPRIDEENASIASLPVPAQTAKEEIYKTEISTPSLHSETTLPGQEVEGEISECEKEIASLKEKKLELEETLNKMKEKALKGESDISYKIMGEIYDVIEEVALEKGYAIIFDKINIIYTRQDTDITGEVIKRLNDKFWD